MDQAAGALEKHAKETDARIKAAFRNSYIYRHYLKNDSLHIEVSNGVLQLTGTAADDIHRSLAEHAAAALHDVVRVDNEVQTKAQADADEADTSIARRIKLSLLLHKNVSASHTDVSVENGVVTLTGKAKSATQKELTAEYASDITGVDEVINQMTVEEVHEPEARTASEKIDDASVEAQGRTVLRSHHLLKTLDTRVVVRDGKVKLTGIAGDAAEKSLVTKLIADIDGVTKVKNQMTINEE